MPRMDLSTSNTSTATWRKRMCPSSSQSQSVNMNCNSTLNSCLTTTKKEGEKNTSLQSNKTIFDFNPIYRIMFHYQYSTTVPEEWTPEWVVLKHSCCTAQLFIFRVPESTSVSAKPCTQISRNGPQLSGSWDQAETHQAQLRASLYTTNPPSQWLHRDFLQNCNSHRFNTLTV